MFWDLGNVFFVFLRVTQELSLGLRNELLLLACGFVFFFNNFLGTGGKQ